MAGYWMVRSSAPKDPEAQQEYRKRWQPIAEKYQATIIAGRDRQQEPEGQGLPQVLLVKFPSYDLAVRCYEDQAYQEALVYAHRAYDRELVIVEGSDD